MGLALLLYVSMLIYCIKSIYRAKENVSELMMMNDSELAIRQQNA